MLMFLLYSLLFVTCLLIGSALLGVFVLYYFLPAHLCRLLSRINLLRHGLRQQYVKLGADWLSYAERGKPRSNQTSIIFIHGFTSSKDAWVTMTQYLPSDLHMIIVDLPGHGLTSYQLSGDDLNIAGFTAYLHQFLQILGLKQAGVHLVGQSMGGSIAAQYSATYPQHVTCTTLICPGMKTPTMSKVAQMWRAEGEDFPLNPDSLEKVKDMIKLTIYAEVNVPHQILKGILLMRKPREKHFKELMKNLRSDFTREDWLSRLPSIQCPVQIVWGEHDNVVDKSGIETLSSKLVCPLQVHLLPRCGHAVNIERPRKLAKLLNLFHQSHHKQQETQYVR